ncbi:hypothetical protein [Cesiribacter sp. SM1]|uniref:hypothetical protein n=1 Tax=Cesiribacter sp. SM1 TaxID=2861196 RepID=UPI001CD5D1D4|nr:hypothetical protein [Cesiribacter sp. SM1]
MEAYTDPNIIIQRITRLLQDEDTRNWRIGVGLIRTLGNPYELGVEQMHTFKCSPKITLQVIDYLFKHLGVKRDDGWTYPEIDNTELVLYKKKAKSLAA